ncbi:MAG: hypothetical protein A3K60_00695 [Euryarchaeota archaeon RBG_19FT_COMBO_56_21]|nr:MAG: hypothetical protein A3K60_00695 [Euryarchaeota archaeon RBG_19FT_COMBO_56_21]
MDDEMAIVIRLIVAACAAIPFVVFLLSYLRTRMTRLLLAALGFGIFVVKEILLAAGMFTIVIKENNPHSPAVTHSDLALLEGVIDLAIILLFVAAVLWKQGASVDGKAGAGDKKDSV